MNKKISQCRLRSKDRKWGNLRPWRYGVQIVRMHAPLLEPTSLSASSPSHVVEIKLTQKSELARAYSRRLLSTSSSISNWANCANNSQWALHVIFLRP